MKKYLKQEHVTTFFGLVLLALTTGIIEFKTEYIPYVMFIAGALTLFGYKVPTGFIDYFKKKEIVGDIDNEDEKPKEEPKKEEEKPKDEVVAPKPKTFVKPQYTSNIIRFTQLSHENGAYDFGDDNKGVDEIYMPYDGKILYEGYDKPFYNTGAIVIIMESTEEIKEGYKAITWIWHLSQTFVDKGKEYKQGALIGHEGNTGRSTASHSHVGMAIVPTTYKFNADLNTWKHLTANYVVDLIDNVYVYPHQKVIKTDPNGLYQKIQNRIKFL